MSRNRRAHLTEEEFIGFILEDLTEEEEAEVDQHLQRCIPCAQRLELFYDAQEQFPTKEWAAQRDTFAAGLRERVQAVLADAQRQRLTAALTGVALMTLVARRRARAATPITEEGQVELAQGTLRWRIVEESPGDLVIRFGAHQPDWNGLALAVTAGSWSREVVLRPVAEDQVGAELVLTSVERAALPHDAVLRIAQVRHS